MCGELGGEGLDGLFFGRKVFMFERKGDSLLLKGGQSLFLWRENSVYL